MKLVDTLFNKISENQFDYADVVSKSFVRPGAYCSADTAFIVTARNRREFSKPLYEHFKRAKNKFGKEIKFVLVEHSETPEHLDFSSAKDDVTYIHIPALSGEPFNKCLSYNVGALLSNECSNFIFHDLDILFKDSFFSDVFENAERGGYEAMQCYGGRRVLWCSPNLTKHIIDGRVDVGLIGSDSEGIDLPATGSTGGSLFVKRDLFIGAGGYDPEFFHSNSPEDQFFWGKLSCLTDMGYADAPYINAIHMWHRPAWDDNAEMPEMMKILYMFRGMNDDEKLEFISKKSSVFLESVGKVGNGGKLTVAKKKKIKVFCSWDLNVDLEHYSDTELYVDRLPSTMHDGKRYRFVFMLEPPTFLNISKQVLANQHLYDYVLTYDDFVLNNCPKAVEFPMASSWVGHLEPNEKRFEISTLAGFKMLSEGHALRKILWYNQHRITVPKKFYLSHKHDGIESICDNPVLMERMDDKIRMFESQFHIAIESTMMNGFFSEKLVDALITKTVPIYYGCPNISKWFDTRGMYLVRGVEDIVSVCNALREDTYASMADYVNKNYELARQYVNLGSRIADKIKSLLSQ